MRKKECDLPANGWKPRDYQLDAWKAMEAGTKLISLWWHRRSGKDELAMQRTAVAAFERPGAYWHLLPEADQARRVIWDVINPQTGRRRVDEIFPMEIRQSTRNTDMFIRFTNGSTWQLIGSDNYDSLIGAPPVGIVFSEWARSSPLAWGYLSPILAENNGWAIFATTPQGKNHAWKTHNALKSDPNSYASERTVDDTGVFTPAALAAERQRLNDIYGEAMGLALFQQEYYCSAEAAIIGSIYGEEVTALKNSGRIGCEPANTLVHTAWDIGHSDATAIWWFQVSGHEIRILDYEEANLQDLGYYSERVKGRRIRSELGSWAYGHQPIQWGEEIEDLDYRRGYAYGTHFLPHDAANKTLSASGYSVEDILRKSLGNVRVVEETRTGFSSAAKTAAIAALRRSRVSQRAVHGLETLAEYRYSYDENRNILSATPLHNDASHCADAFRVLALSEGKVTLTPSQPKLAPIRYPRSGVA